MSRTEKQKIGTLGEDIACTYLIKEGYTIITRNYRKPWGELDIVAQKGNILHIVEVKTVSISSVIHETVDKYEPEDNIHPWKLQKIYRTTMTFLTDMGFDEDDVDWQLDAITVYLERGSGKFFRLEYLEDIG